MGRIAPFRALRFDVGRIGDPGAVWAPPYDVIKGDAASELRARHSNNIVRITNPEGDGPARYVEAAETLAAWTTQGILARDAEHSVYVHRHRFDFAGAPHVRTGVWALTRLVPFDSGVVLPHEHTMRGPKADRLALMRACRTQLSPIFFICSDPNERIREALAECADGIATETTEFPAGHGHEIWRVSGGAAAQLASILADQILLIADGHHRYETALAYREGLIGEGAPQLGDGAHHYLLAYIVPEGDPGLLLLPTHRIVTGARVDWTEAIGRVEDRFQVRRLDEAEVDSADVLLEEERGHPSFIIVAADEVGGWQLRSRHKGGDGISDAYAGIAAVAFHDVFVPEALGLSPDEAAERVTYSRDPGEAMERLRSGSATGVVLLAPPSVAQIREAAQVGERTPTKTTFFWPKVPTGVAFHAIDPEEPVGQ